MSESLWNIVVKAATSIWPVVTGLAGVLIGGYIANRNQRKHWVADCKKGEYRELVSVLSRAMTTYVLVYSTPPIKRPDRTLLDEQTAMAEIAHDRLFIRDNVIKLRVLEQWQDASTTIADKNDVVAFGVTVHKLLKEIQEAAIEDISH